MKKWIACALVAMGIISLAGCHHHDHHRHHDHDSYDHRHDDGGHHGNRGGR
ncbi:MAG: hypothetical protein IK089_02920 [Oxalobacter sp.]|nr:hypothetical protein [Oxalobacter sp.]